MVSQTNENWNIDTLSPKEQINTFWVEKQKFFDEIKKSNIKEETKNNIKKILEKISDDDFFTFIDGIPELASFIDTNTPITDVSNILNQFIDSFENKIDQGKRNNWVERNNQEINVSDDGKVYSENNTEQKKKEALKILNNRKDDFKKIFWENSEFFQLFEKYKDDELETELTEFLSKPENRKAVFDKIAATWDVKLYQETYSSLCNLSPTIAWYLKDISPVIYEIEPKPVKVPPEIVAQLPWAKPEDIERRWNLVSYWDKTIDLKTKKAFISGEWGYAIETSMQVPNSLDIRAKYLAERLEIIDEIKTNEKILHLLENKETLKQKLETLKNNKSTQEKSAQDLQIDIEINAIETEVKKINEKLKTAIPWYSEEQDNNLKTFLKEKITQSQEKLTALKTKFDEDMQKLLEAWQDEILARDKKVRETMSFLDDLWITNINQNDLQKIIDRINIHPHAYGFSKPIDLKAWFEWSPTDALKQKKEFFHLFSKIYEKMNFIPPVNESIIEWFTKDERLKNDTIFKQKLEDIWVTRGWAIQIETVMNILWEKPEERERVYNGKPTQAEIINETVETK